MQAIGLALIASVDSATAPYSSLVFPFILSGTGMALFFAPVANVVLSSVRPGGGAEASGANTATRELGAGFGVAVLASICSQYGGSSSGTAFVAGMTPALWVGA